jgi:hypothetical protein
MRAGKHNKSYAPRTQLAHSQPRRRAPRVGLRGGRGRSYSIAERLAARTIKSSSPDGCWLIQGCGIGVGGYGQIKLDAPSRQLIPAHHAAWLLAHGPIPDGLVVMHICDEPRCVRLDHLQLGTQAQNVQDSVQKGRHSLWRQTGVRLNGQAVRVRDERKAV